MAPSPTDVSQEPVFSTSPTRSSITVNTTPTLVHQNILQPRITPAPSSCPPNTLVVQLSTTLVIPNYNLFYAPISIETFIPTYSTLPDGSLLTPPFHQDLINSNLGLVLAGALATVFARNILVSGDYIRRGKVKKKTLFYVLFLSQILAPVAIVPIILSYFTQQMSCTLVVVLACLSGTTSLALLITVILGVKVYKCLNNRRFIPVVLGLFQIGSTTVVIFDVIKTRGIRRLTGSCIRTDDLRFTRYFVILQFLESLFICCCFVYVCWKSRGSPAARGRISIELSMDDLPIEFPSDPADNLQTTRRGWWDYVPENPSEMRTSQIKLDSANGLDERRESTFRGFVNKMTRSRSMQQPVSSDSNEKASKLQKRLNNAHGNPSAASQREDSANPSARHSFTPSSASKFRRIVPRMELFQQVMKDELLYTTFITFNCVIVAVLIIIGVNVKNGLSVTGWIALNWCIVSLLAIHSFGRVVHRHERDALLQHPTTCTAIARAANDMVKRDERNGRRVLSSLPGRTKSLRITTSTINRSSDPFADTQPLEPNASLNSALGYSSSIISVARSSPLQENQTSYAPDMLTHFPSSPPDQDFPTSNLATPVVALSELDVAQQEFSRSWLVSSGSFEGYSLFDEHTMSRKEAT
ncbi:hypothetical protein BDZ97DRAFT_403352 [Flammula alnicola]|nr:hypothetical protein BDZ97DRAFT_403352 [Flammula alnicola]